MATSTICMFAALSVVGTCGLIIALIVKELTSAEGQGQRPCLVDILKKVEGSLTIAIMYLLITLSLVATMIVADILS